MGCLFRIQHLHVTEAQAADTGFNFGAVADHYPDHVIGLYHGGRGLANIAKAHLAHPGGIGPPR